MGPVAERLAVGMLAAAEKHRLGLGRVILHGREFAALVRPVAEWLVLAAPAGAPPITFAGRYVVTKRRPLRDRGFGHGKSPITAQFDRADPISQSLADA